MKTLKCELYLPENKIEEMVQAMDREGFLRMGHYREVYALTEVKGHWRPVAGANPYLGELGEAQEAEEYKLEFNLPADRKQRCLEIILRQHPYEEPLIRFIPME